MSAFRTMGRLFATWNTDYYTVLGVARTANQKDIRMAYLGLAKKHHPDTPTGSTEKFKELANAY